MNDFEKQLINILDEKRKQMKEQYSRVLPSGELLWNRFDKAEFCDSGEGSSIYDTSIIMGNVSIGDNVWIGPYTILEGINAPIIIGNFVSINAGALIYSHDSTKYYVSGGIVPFKKGAVSIGDYTVVGSMSMIACGVSIGSHCVIGAHSMVTSDVPDNSIYAGVPAKRIGTVEVMDSDVIFKYD